jgi:hypothetical protein
MLERKINEVNPYASPQPPDDGDATRMVSRGPARWLSLRGVLAAVCFVLAASTSAVSALGCFILVSVAGFNKFHGVSLWRFGACVAGTVAFILMGLGIRTGRRRVAIFGFVIALPLAIAVSVFLYGRWAS